MADQLSVVVVEGGTEQMKSPKRKQRRWSLEEDGRLLSMLSVKARRKDIAAEMGRTPAAVSSRRQELVRSGRYVAFTWCGRGANRNTAWRPEEIQELCRMLEAGKSFPIIARVLHRNQTEIASMVGAMRNGIAVGV